MNEVGPFKALESINGMIPEYLKWCLMSGSAAFLYGSNRMPTDVDILTRASDMNTIASCLKDFIIKQPEITRRDIFKMFYSKFEINNYEVEIVSDTITTVENNSYLFSLDDEMVKRIRNMKVNEIKIPVISPEDLVVLKAISQRGKEKGKYDVEDVISILNNQKIDWEYLKKRTQITQSYERVFGLLKRLGYNE